MKATALGLVFVSLAMVSCSKPATLDDSLIGHWRQTSEQLAAVEPGWRHGGAAAKAAAASTATNSAPPRQVDLYIDKQIMWTVDSNAPKRQEAYTVASVDPQRASLVQQLGSPGDARTAAAIVFSDDRKEFRRIQTITSPEGTFTVTRTYRRVDDKTAP